MAGKDWLDKLQVANKVLILNSDDSLFAVGIVSQTNKGVIGGKERARPLQIVPQGVFYIRTLQFSGKTGKENRGTRALAPYNETRAKAWEEHQAASEARARIQKAEEMDRRRETLLKQLEKVDWQIVLEDFGETAMRPLEQVIVAYVVASEKGQEELEKLNIAVDARFKDPMLAPYRRQALGGDLDRETLQWLVEEASEEDIIAWIHGEDGE
jgi:hypothetical protein